MSSISSRPDDTTHDQQQTPYADAISQFRSFIQQERLARGEDTPPQAIVQERLSELATTAISAGYRSTLGPVFVIDPTGVGHRYDPLHGRHTEDELLSAATHLLFKPDEGDGAIFTQRATVMLTQLFLAAREEGIPPLPYARLMIRAGLPKAARRLNELSTELATQFLDVEFEEANLADRFLLSAWGTLTARMRSLLTETVVRTVSGVDFKAGDLIQGSTPVTVYLRWPERDLLALSPLVRLLWGSIIDELITTYDKREGRNCSPVLLLIDDAGRTAIPSLADHSTTVVGRGVSLWIAVQSLSQLDAVYGKVRAQILRDKTTSSAASAEPRNTPIPRPSGTGPKQARGLSGRGCPYLQRGK